MFTVKKDVNSKTLTHDEVVMLETILEQNGYPSHVIGYLLRSLGLDDVSSLSDVTVGVADVLISYASQARIIKGSWKRIKNGEICLADVNLCIPEIDPGTGRKISKARAKFYLKNYWRQRLKEL